MNIISPNIFKKFPDIICAFSTKVGLNRQFPYHFNMSYTVGDDENIVRENRKSFYEYFGLQENQVAYQKQTHSDIITYVDKGGLSGESDALITDKYDLGLSISSADCTAIFLYDRKNKIIAAVHSGWRGTASKILDKTINRLINEFNSDTKNLFVYLAPSVSQENYEIGPEVAEKFSKKYLLEREGKIYLDVGGNNYDILLARGIPENQIEKSPLCSYYEIDLLHSYRREGQKSGRAFGIIVKKS